MTAFLDHAAAVWNRAAAAPDAGSREGFGQGDDALADVLLLHGYAMGGGLLVAVQSLLPEQVEAAADGFVLLGLPDAADLVRDVSDRAMSANQDALGELEIEASERYAALVPSDSALDGAFQALLRDEPPLFAPV
ncbi:MAG: hypothetical protein LCI03_12410 [Actinobacteria bacterium]|nr:hypothetical protein [Actinomycetota bacterium]